MTIASWVLAVSFLPFFEAKNTAVNYLLNPPDGNESVVCEKPSLVVHERCPACEGKGEIMLAEQNFGQANGRIGGVGQKKRIKCPVCKGQKKLEAFENPANLTLQVARDRERFNSQHQGRGEVPVGQAFIPQADYERIKSDRTKLKLLENAYGKPCPTCHWTGLEACKKCDGQGVMPCPNADCKGGWAVVKTTTSFTRTKSGGSSGTNRGGFRSSGGTRRVSQKQEKVNVNVCPVCDGASVILCPDCQGRRAKPCRKCNGLGVKQKGFGS